MHLFFNSCGIKCSFWPADFCNNHIFGRERPQSEGELRQFQKDGGEPPPILPRSLEICSFATGDKFLARLNFKKPQHEKQRGEIGVSSPLKNQKRREMCDEVMNVQNCFLKSGLHEET